MIRFKTLALLSVLTLVLGCSPSLTTSSKTPAPNPDSETEAVRQKGKLVMLCFPTLAGGISPDLAHGTTRRVGSPEHFKGFEVSLMELLARRLGVELEIRTLSEPGYEPLIPAMLEGQSDLVASTLSITPERERRVDFSIPYEFAYQVVVTQEGVEIHSDADLLGKTAVAARGSSHHQHLSLLGVEDSDIHFVDFVEEYFTAIADGQADFAVVDSFEPDRLDELQNTQHVEGLVVAYTFPDMDRIATAMPAGSDLKQHLDDLIRELEADGRLEEMRKKARAERAALM